MPPRYADKRYYLTADRSRVVEEGDPEAAVLLAAEGTLVAEEDAKRYGLDLSEKGAARAALPGREAEPTPALALEEQLSRLDAAKARGMAEEVRVHQEILRRDHGAEGAKAADAVGEFEAKDAVSIKRDAPAHPDADAPAKSQPEPAKEAEAPKSSAAARRSAPPADAKK